MISFRDRMEARAAIRQLRAPGLKELAKNRVIVRAVAQTVKDMEAADVDTNKVLSALAELHKNEIVSAV